MPAYPTGGGSKLERKACCLLLCNTKLAHFFKRRMGLGWVGPGSQSSVSVDETIVALPSTDSFSMRELRASSMIKFCLFRWHPAVLVMLPTLPTAAVSRLTNHLTNMLRGISLRQTIRNQHRKEELPTASRCDSEIRDTNPYPDRVNHSIFEATIVDGQPKKRHGFFFDDYSAAI